MHCSWLIARGSARALLSLSAACLLDARSSAVGAHGSPRSRGAGRGEHSAMMRTRGRGQERNGSNRARKASDRARWLGSMHSCTRSEHDTAVIARRLHVGQTRTSTMLRLWQRWGGKALGETLAPTVSGLALCPRTTVPAVCTRLAAAVASACLLAPPTSSAECAALLWC